MSVPSMQRGNSGAASELPGNGEYDKVEWLFATQCTGL